MNRLDTLIKARNLINTGWIQGTLHRRDNGHDAYCMVGAINAATQHNPFKMIVVSNLIRAELPISRITSWNDRWSRNKDDVLRVFDRAIAKEQKRRLRLSWLARRLDAKYGTQQITLDTPPAVVVWDNYTPSSPEPGPKPMPVPPTVPQKDDEDEILAQARGAGMMVRP